MDFEHNKGQTKVELVQIALPNLCFLIKRKFIDQNIRNIIENPKILKMGSAIMGADQKVVLMDLQIQPEGLVDTQTIGNIRFQLLLKKMFRFHGKKNRYTM